MPPIRTRTNPLSKLKPAALNRRLQQLERNRDRLLADEAAEAAAVEAARVAAEQAEADARRLEEEAAAARIANRTDVIEKARQAREELDSAEEAALLEEAESTSTLIERALAATEDDPLTPDFAELAEAGMQFIVGQRVPARLWRAWDAGYPAASVDFLGVRWTVQFSYSPADSRWVPVLFMTVPNDGSQRPILDLRSLKAVFSEYPNLATPAAAAETAA